MIPDYCAPIVAWRVWDKQEGSVDLRAVTGSYWWPRRPVEAVCNKRVPSPWGAVPHASDPVPFNCSCGIYAFPSFIQAIKSFGCSNWNTIVLGQVYLWGKVVVHTVGYRAQYAYPKALIMQGTNYKEVGALYNVPVEHVPNIEQYLRRVFNIPNKIPSAEILPFLKEVTQ